MITHARISPRQSRDTLLLLDVLAAACLADPWPHGLSPGSGPLATRKVSKTGQRFGFAFLFLGSSCCLVLQGHEHGVLP